MWNDLAKAMKASDGKKKIRATSVTLEKKTSSFDFSNAAKEGVAPEAAAPRLCREGLVLQKHVVEGTTICAQEFWPL